MFKEDEAENDPKVQIDDSGGHLFTVCCCSFRCSQILYPVPVLKSQLPL